AFYQENKNPSRVLSLILGVWGRNFCPPSLSDSDFSAAAEFRASKAGAPPIPRKSRERWI
ncbi:MAG: hypothetical protein ABIJ85_01560, partial [bacterium]